MDMYTVEHYYELQEGERVRECHLPTLNTMHPNFNAAYATADKVREEEMQKREEAGFPVVTRYRIHRYHVTAQHITAL